MKAPEESIDCLVVKALKADSGYLSGEGLAKKLKISRQAFWKHINNLIDKGYDIAAAPHLGYRLISSPDKLYPEEIKSGLNTKFIGKEVYHYQSLDSTQSLVWKLGLEGQEEGFVVFAETQKKGKGRMQRKWISPSGGIYLSLLLRPKFLSLDEVSQISLVISLACVRAIKQATGIECQVKWPNDIVLAEKKIGGILCEINAETDRIHFLVVGIGININSTNLPSEATSLLLNAKLKFSRLDIAKMILREIESCYLKAQSYGFRTLLEEWSRLCFLWGRRLRVKILERTIEGEAQGIDERGYLLLRDNNGLVVKVSAGDIVKVNSLSKTLLEERERDKEREG